MVDGLVLQASGGVVGEQGKKSTSPMLTLPLCEGAQQDHIIEVGSNEERQERVAI